MRALSMFAAVTVLCAPGALVPGELGHARGQQDARFVPTSALADPRLVLTHARGRLEISGITASADHEQLLQRVAAKAFGGAAIETSFEAGVLFPDDWAETSMQIVRALAVTESGSAIMNGSRVAIRGVTADAATLETRLEALQAALHAKTQLKQDFVIVDASASMAALCRRNLAYAANQPIAFSQSSSKLRTSSHHVLDKIIEVANDCRDSRILVTGHSDASGDESWNQMLSLQRAQAVADHIIDAGISRERLVVAGRGSSLPVADNATAQGRSRNRRIEFELR
jgi:OOP family OmpA-OmpF porin